MWYYLSIKYLAIYSNNRNVTIFKQVVLVNLRQHEEKTFRSTKIISICLIMTRYKSLFLTKVDVDFVRNILKL